MSLWTEFEQYAKNSELNADQIKGASLYVTWLSWRLIDVGQKIDPTFRIVAHPTKKLGKHPRVTSTKTLDMTDYTGLVPNPPKAIDWTGKIPSMNWGMFQNDKIGDCTIASAAHLIMLWTANASKEIVPTDNDVLKAYEAVSGYIPESGANDNGAVELDVLNYWRKTGIAGHKIEAFSNINHRNQKQVMQGIWLFGGTYAGFQLPISAQEQEVWTVPDSGAAGDGEPGSWGGHAVPIVAYDADFVWCVTWGKLLKMTWAFFFAYCDEDYGVLSKDWLMQAAAPNGFDLRALTADLKAL